MGFIENQVGLAQQAAKANAYDQMLAARDAEYMASQYANAGFQKGVETALRQVSLYAASEVRNDAQYNRFANGADYRPQQVPPVANQGLSGKAWDTREPVRPATETELWLQRMREQKAKGQ